MEIWFGKSRFVRLVMVMVNLKIGMTMKILMMIMIIN